MDRRESVAAVLRRAREKHGQDVRSVAQVLRIRQGYLEALESGRFDRLPGTAYALGFLRTYAEYLGLDANDIVDRFKEEVQGPERQTELVFPEPVAEARIPGGAIILISVVLLSAAYGGWFYLSNQGRSVADLIPALPDRIQTLIDGETESAPPEPPEPTDNPVVSAEAPAGTDGPREAEAPAGDTPEAEPAAAEVAEPPISETPGAETAVAEAPAVEAAPEPAPEPTPAPTPAPAAVESPVSPQELLSLTRPSPATQVAAVPEAADAQEAASDAGSGLSVSPEPAPEPETANPATPAPVEYQALQAAPSPAVLPSPPPAPVQSAALPEAPAQVPLQSESSAQPAPAPLAEPTVVIPAPPQAPRSFAQPGARAPQVYGESNEDARIVLRAIQDSWVQVRDGQDGLLLTRVLRSGDVYRVPDQPGLTLLTGNAGGLALEVDGVRLPPLGPVGSVRRQIALDPSTLLGQNE